MLDAQVEDLLRQLAPQVLAAVVRRYGHFDLAEDAVQDSLLAAAVQWPRDGLPDRPRGWLVTVAGRRLTDLLRSEQARRRREGEVRHWALSEQRSAPPADQPATDVDDTLVLFMLCCHPVLPAASQIALTLRAVGGLRTEEIARAFLVSKETMARRINRAKQTIKASGVPFALPAPTDRRARVSSVLHVLYLMFNEGYASTSGTSLYREELCTEAIRLARLAHRVVADDTEAAGLLALMLLIDARRAARLGPRGELVPMAEQDRQLWNTDRIVEGIALLEHTLPLGNTGPYQLQAAIAALHDQAETFEATDWPQILALYTLLLRVSDTPVVRLNHAVAYAMVHGPRAGLELLDDLRAEQRIAADHRLHAVRAHLLETAGDHAGARDAYLSAAALAISVPQQRYLHARAVGLPTA